MKVLIVDDNREIIELLTEFMIFSGFETDSAGNGLEALAKLSKGGFDTVITDGHMPLMSGFELCRYIKSMHPSIFTIGITDSLSLDRFREAGADVSFFKPVDFSLLGGLIESRAVC
ncbi:MAG: response regulator [Syntrophales bacterium]|nr:response regulator [Syntrophales bacterium]MDD5234084.1 response regulator [Syntrophales bacterium]MDD5532314.1 response regulator [Syntrophales bacterium]HPL64388.1 response regulator [Syntrophales bacterium]